MLAAAKVRVVFAPILQNLIRYVHMDKRVTLQVSAAIAVGVLVAIVVLWNYLPDTVATAETAGVSVVSDATVVGDDQVDLPLEPPPLPPLDTAAYDLKLRQLAHFVESVDETDDHPQPLLDEGGETRVAEPLWPVRAAYPNPGAILPFSRIVAYYGNFYSRGMGVLGQYDPDEMLRRLAVEVDSWNAADPTTPVVPAIDYIAATAQLSPGADGKYRFRMPDSQKDKAVELAERIGGIVILEVQPGLADVMGEVRHLEPYLKLPNVHLAIDPEFAMIVSGRRPGTVVGTVDASTVNEAAEYLAALVRDNGLPPKVLMVHRYTRAMVTNATKIVPLPEVQIIIDMDGWGPPSQKIATYNAYINPEPVQFTGFKLFYRNDFWGGGRMMTPEEILALTPSPSFIQYQ